MDRGKFQNQAQHPDANPKFEIRAKSWSPKKRNSKISNAIESARKEMEPQAEPQVRSQSNRIQNWSPRFKTTALASK